jgi:hypothetical protein
MAVFGPTFVSELQAAGLTGLPFSWDAATGVITGRENLTTQQNATLTAVIAAHDSNKTAVPQTVSSMQAKVALSRAGLLTSVQTWVNSQSAETQLVWNTATTFSRNSGIILAGASALGLSSAQLDALFITAATIQP